MENCFSSLQSPGEYLMQVSHTTYIHCKLNTETNQYSCKWQHYEITTDETVLRKLSLSL